MLDEAVNTLLFDLKGVSFSVAGHAILDRVDLSLAPGRVYGLIGSNGSGKSTLVKILARQLSPTGGTARFEGKPLADWSDRSFAHNVAYMPQFTPASDGMNVRELVSLGRFPWHGTLGRFTETDGAKVTGAIERTGLSDYAERMVDSLSGGERQRVWLAMMLAQDTRCILLDEPTSALDVANETRVLTLLQDLCRERGIAVVVVLHDVNLAARTCDEIIALRGGRVIAQAPAREIMTAEILADIYGVPMGVLTHPLRGDPIGYVL
jgi:iron complex transport system ATP-binding protein